MITRRLVIVTRYHLPLNIFDHRTIVDTFWLQVGVVAVPEVTEYSLTPQDEFLLLASDGVWEFIDNQEASIERTPDDF